MPPGSCLSVVWVALATEGQIRLMITICFSGIDVIIAAYTEVPSRISDNAAVLDRGVPNPKVIDRGGPGIAALGTDEHQFVFPIVTSSPYPEAKMTPRPQFPALPLTAMPVAVS